MSQRVTNGFGGGGSNQPWWGTQGSSNNGTMSAASVGQGNYQDGGYSPYTANAYQPQYQNMGQFAPGGDYSYWGENGFDPWGGETARDTIGDWTASWNSDHGDLSPWGGNYTPTQFSGTAFDPATMGVADSVINPLDVVHAQLPQMREQQRLGNAMAAKQMGNAGLLASSGYADALGEVNRKATNDIGSAYMNIMGQHAEQQAGRQQQANMVNAQMQQEAMLADRAREFQAWKSYEGLMGDSSNRDLDAWGLLSRLRDSQGQWQGNLMAQGLGRALDSLRNEGMFSQQNDRLRFDQASLQQARDIALMREITGQQNFLANQGLSYDQLFANNQLQYDQLDQARYLQELRDQQDRATLNAQLSQNAASQNASQEHDTSESESDRQLQRDQDAQAMLMNIAQMLGMDPYTSNEEGLAFAQELVPGSEDFMTNFFEALQSMIDSGDAFNESQGGGS